MRVVLQRVEEASVSVDGSCVGSIKQGYCILLGVCESDNRLIVEKMVDKIGKLRLFQDDQGKTNLSLTDVKGEILVVSQFTLLADCKKGNRPSFTQAGSPVLAKQLYEEFIECCKGYTSCVAHGEFGADMKVKLTNDGPFTIVLEADEKGVK